MYWTVKRPHISKAWYIIYGFQVKVLDSRLLIDDNAGRQRTNTLGSIELEFYTQENSETYYSLRRFFFFKFRSAKIESTICRTY